jgi:hypothetical protein
MGLDPDHSVVNEWGRCHDMKNLLIVDGSMSVTSGGVNPTSTIQALALYIADSIKKRLATLFDGTGPRSQPRLVSLLLVCYRRNLAVRPGSGEGQDSTHSGGSRRGRDPENHPLMRDRETVPISRH